MDEQLCMMGFGVSLPEKVDKAIRTFQHYEAEALKRDPVNGYYLCDSYGKDSCVILDLAKRSGVKFVAHHNLTTLDPPELIRFGRQYHPETVVHRPKMAMLSMVTQSLKGPPTRLSRWCCAVYKEGAQGESVAVFGVRAQESNRRAARWKTWTPYRGGSWVLNPILFWTDEDVWRYIRQNRLPYCSLYDEGRSRLGCIGCPMAGREGRERDFRRWPRYGEAWKRAVSRFYENWSGLPRLDGGERWMDRQANIHSADDLWRWWMEELPEPDDDDCQMGLF